MTEDLTKKIKIKHGVLKRLHKEYLSYVDETETLQTKYEQFKAANPDDNYSLKKKLELVEDSAQMVPESKKRLQAAYEEFSELMTKSSDFYQQLEEGQATLKTIEPLFVPQEKNQAS